MKTKLFERHWLNTEEVEGGSGFIRTDDSEIKIGDCNRIVSLEFWCDEDTSIKSLNNLLYKIDILYATIGRFRKHTKGKVNKLLKEKKNDD